MSISQTLTTSFKQQLLQGVHDFSTDIFYMALYTANADIGAATTEYNVSLAGQVATQRQGRFQALSMCREVRP